MQISSTMMQKYSTMGQALRSDTAQEAAPATRSTPATGYSTAGNGDTVAISEEGRSLAAGSAGTGKSEDSSQTTQEQMIDRIKDQIKKLQEEIKELQGNPSMSEEEKQKQIQMKQSELMQMQFQLQKAMEEQAKAGGISATGGTRANGFASSLAG